MTSAAKKETGFKELDDIIPTQIITSDVKACLGVEILAPSTNADTIYIGFRDTIDNAQAEATSGFPLAPGDSINIPTRNPSEIYAMGGGGTNKLFWMIV